MQQFNGVVKSFETKASKEDAWVETFMFHH
jgi:hypothetical protein